MNCELLSALADGMVGGYQLKALALNLLFIAICFRLKPKNITVYLAVS
jgi:hypothetical protein